MRSRDHATKQDRRFRALVLVPSLGLAGAWRELLGARQVDAEVHTVDTWLADEARHAFPGLPARDSEQAGGGVIRLKRHPAVREVLDDVAERADGPTSRDDLFELWGDQRLLRDIEDLSDGDLCGRDARQVLDHAMVQFAELDRHEDGSLVLGMQGVPLHEGTPLHDAGTHDVEDYPVLFELDRRRGGGRQPRRVDHIVVDEAQEVAPMELAVIRRALRPRGTLTVVGDAAQQLDPSAWFAGWAATLAELGVAGSVRVSMSDSHRCPPAVMALARALLHDLPVEPAGAGVYLAPNATPHEPHRGLVEWLAADPQLRTVVVASDGERAASWQRALQPVLGTTLDLEGAEPLPAGVTVTITQRLRGLEVDRVVVPEVPSEPDAAQRRALYLAVTRATRSVWLGSRRHAAG